MATRSGRKFQSSKNDLPPKSPSSVSNSTSKRKAASSLTKKLSVGAGESPSVKSAESDTSRESLALNVQKSLAEVVEGVGRENIGRGKSNLLSSLLDKADPAGEVFGSQGSRTRFRVGKKFDRWKDLSRDKWFRVLATLKVEPRVSESTIKRRARQEGEKPQEATTNQEVPKVISIGKSDKQVAPTQDSKAEAELTSAETWSAGDDSVAYQEEFQGQAPKKKNPTRKKEKESMAEAQGGKFFVCVWFCC